MKGEEQEKIKNIIAEKISVSIDKVLLGARLEELGADSLDRVAIVMDIEDEFDIEIPDEEVEKFHKVEDILNYLSGRI